MSGEHRSEGVKGFLRAWSQANVVGIEYPLTLTDARAHAAAFTLAAASEGISAAQIQQAISERDLTDVMVLEMRGAVENSISRPDKRRARPE